MRKLQALIFLGVLLAAGCAKEDTGEANLPKPMSEAEIQKLSPEQQENIRNFQKLQEQNSGGKAR